MVEGGARKVTGAWANRVAILSVAGAVTRNGGPEIRGVTERLDRSLDRDAFAAFQGRRLPPPGRRPGIFSE
jgi:hypothetical protein